MPTNWTPEKIAEAILLNDDGTLKHTRAIRALGRADLETRFIVNRMLGGHETPERQALIKKRVRLLGYFSPRAHKRHANQYQDGTFHMPRRAAERPIILIARELLAQKPMTL